MPILNYTTKVSPERTVNQIQAILVKAGARGIMIEYQDKKPVTVVFAIEYRSQEISYRLPCRWERVHHLLKESAGRNAYKTEEHAHRVAWRIIKDWVEAQLAIVESDLVDLPEVFLPYAIGQDGRTVYESFESRNFLLGEGR